MKISRYFRLSLTAFLTAILTISSTSGNFTLLLQASQVLAQTGNSRQAQANELLRQGVQQIQAAQLDAALQSFQQALIIYRQIKDRVREGYALGNIATTYSLLRNYQQAAEFYQQALVITKELKKRDDEKDILGKLARAYQDLQNYPKAIEYYQQFLVLAREFKDRESEIIALGSLGRVYDALEDLPQAINYYQQALAIARQIQDREKEIPALGNLGEAYLNLENYATAIEYYQQGLAIASATKNDFATMKFLQALGNAYYYLGDSNTAGQYTQQSLNLARSLKNAQVERQALNTMGNIYYRVGDYDKAIDFYQQNLAIARLQKNRRAEGLALGNIGLSYASKGDAAQSIEYLKQDLAISREFKDRFNEGQTLGYLCIAYAQLKNYNQAVTYCQQSLAIAKETKYNRGEAITLHNLGNALSKWGKLPEAEKALFASIEIAESLRARLGNNDNYKVSIFEEQNRTYRLLQEVLIAQNKIKEALEVAERGRARAFVELLSKRVSANSQGSVNRTLDSKFKKPELPLLQQIAKQQNATLVEYSVIYNDFTIGNQSKSQESELFIWVIKPTGEVTFRKADLKPLWQKDNTSLAKLVTTSRESIGVRGRGGINVESTGEPAKPTQQLQQLHQLLIEPIADILPTNPSDRVIFIPQDSLFLVPFPALKDAQGKYLIEKHTILTAPAIQVLELTNKQKQNLARLGNIKSLTSLVVGNPTMPSVVNKPGDKPEQLPPLPGAEKEAEAIAPLLNTKAIIGGQATKNAIVQKMSQARIIHLATHGLLDDIQGLGSALAFTPDIATRNQPQQQASNGLLTAEEILDLKLQAELVVLSACDTGRGRITGDGVIGLSRSLISAGVPSVIVSLWSVPDAPTAELMTQFYQNFQQRKLDKATALREAMLTTMKTHPKPRDWAAFTLIGEGD